MAHVPSACFVKQLLDTSLYLPRVEKDVVLFRKPAMKTEYMTSQDVNKIDTRLIPLFVHAQEHGYQIESLRATWNLWTNEQPSRVAMDIRNDNPVYVLNITTCYKNETRFDLMCDGCVLNTALSVIGLHAAKFVLFDANVSSAWLQKAFPDHYRRLLTGEELGLASYELSSFICNKSESSEVEALPKDYSFDLF